jgi:hypothetical protein
MFDRIRVLACTLALTGGRFSAMGRPAYLWLDVGTVLLDMLRYLDALMLVFEVGIIYKLWLSSKDFGGVIGEIETESAPLATPMAGRPL